MAANYSIITIDRFGNDQREHPEAKIIEPIRDELNGGGGFAFSVPVSDPYFAAGYLEPVEREVQVFRDGHDEPYFWGPITDTDEIDRRTLEVRVESPFWYFTGLHFGKAGRTNWLQNGSFDDNPANMSPWQAEGVTANLVTAWGTRPNETYQMNLYQAGGGEDTFVTQTVAVPGGHYWTLSASFQIRTDSEWVGPALDNRGLYVERLDPTGQIVEEVQFFAITEATPRGVFEHASIGIHTPPNRDSYLRVRLYATRCTNANPPDGKLPGSIIWDNVKLTLMESHSFVHADLGHVINSIVEHAQDPAFGKANLNIHPATPTTGVLVDRAWQHSDHALIADALLDFAEEGLCDFGFVNVSAMERHFRAYVPTRGTVRDDIVLTLGGDGGLVAMPKVKRDGKRAVTAALALSDKAHGPERDEAVAIDASELGGVVREAKVETPEHGDRLIFVAQEYLRGRKRVVQVPEATAAPELVDSIELGDVIGIDVGDPAPLDANYRVVATELDPENDHLKLTLNGPV